MANRGKELTGILNSAAINLPLLFLIIPLILIFFAASAPLAIQLQNSNVSGKSLRLNSFSLLKTSIVLSCAALFFAGFLSSFSMDLGKESRLFELCQDLKKTGSRYIMIAEGRIMNHIKPGSGSLFFMFKTSRIIIKDSFLKTETAHISGDEIYVKVLTEDKSFLARDDFISFSFIPVKKGNYIHFLTYEERVLRFERPVSGVRERIIFAAFNIRQRFYRCISRVFYDSLKYEHAALCDAIILGNRNNLSIYIIDNFRKSGIYHLLAISGMHISFFIIIIFSLLQLIFRFFPKDGHRSVKAGNILLLAIIIIIVLYNFITGTKASVMRASIMSAFVLYARHLGRDYSNKYLLSICFIVLLILNPLFFSDPGFWLSFACMFAIIYTNGIYKSMFSYLKMKFGKRFIAPKNTAEYKANYFWQLALSTVSVNIFIFPLLFFFFGEFSFLSLPVNMAAVPVFYCMLFILILSSVAGLLWPPAGMAITKAAKPAIIIILKISEQHKKADFLIVHSADFSAWFVVLYYLCLGAALILFYIANTRWEKKHKQLQNI